MDLGLKNKVALIAGASKGIGFAIAKAMAKEGAKLAICSRDTHRIQKAAQLIQDETKATVMASAIDVTKQSDVDQWITDVMQKYGAIHICVTNMGGPPSMPFMQTNETSWQHAVNLTLMGVVHLSRAVIPPMMKQQWGRIIHICSASVRNPIQHLVFSNAIRSAVVALGKTQANELADSGILVNSVLPGWTNTERVGEIMEARAKLNNVSKEQAIENRIATIPLRRMAEPDEIAYPVVFLASECASFITGTTLTVDGGETRFPF